jgi:hypothetical protein
VSRSASGHRGAFCFVDGVEAKISARGHRSPPAWLVRAMPPAVGSFSARRPFVAVMCGDQLVAALIATGVGVVSSAAPLRYVDDQLLDELLAG